LPFKGDAYGAYPDGILMLTLFQFADDKIEKFAPILKTRTSHCQNVAFQPDNQGFDIFG
jgi:hypothetical protein